ncbi:MAG: glycoside hydrolase family 57 protein [Sphaerochaetaceae bacterium]
MNNQIAFVLNAHLPFVRHIEYPRFLEEDWLFESMNESYLPLLRMMNNLMNEGIKFQLTISLSPTLCAMLTDKMLQERFVDYLNLHIELGDKELARLSDNADQKMIDTLQAYRSNLAMNLEDFENLYKRNILEGFKQLSELGYLELITTAATHAYLPAYQSKPVAINAQIETGVMSHAYNFAAQPSGFWLPECGYYPGLEKHLKKAGVNWMHLAAQAFILSNPFVKRVNFAPIQCQNGVYGFARDYALTSLVWSNINGYPCDPDYREFYRDIGYDLPMDYIKPYIHEPEVRVFTGFKYYAITGKTDQKALYDPDKARRKIAQHSKNFVYNVRQKGLALEMSLDVDPIYTLSFDCELFGHWWYEGVSWLEEVIRECSISNDMTLVTPSNYLENCPKAQMMEPCMSSWGEGGFSEVWIDNSSNAWVYRHTFEAIKNMEELAVRFPQQTSLKQRFLNQAARETLLLMASDWPYMIHNKTAASYAQLALASHIKNLNLVYNNMCKNAVNTEWLVKAEKRNNIFKYIDYNIFNPNHLE